MTEQKALHKQIKDAVKSFDLPTIGSIVDHLRLNRGMRYGGIAKLFSDAADLDLPDFENLMIKVKDAKEIDFNDPDNCSCITDAKVCALSRKSLRRGWSRRRRLAQPKC